MERDFAIRFSEEQYLTKDEIKTVLKMSNIDSIWDRVLAYRNLYKREIELVSIEDKTYSVCLTQELVAKLFRLERKFTRNMISFFKSDAEKQKEIVAHCLFEIGKSYAKVNSLTISDEQILSILYDDGMVIPQAFLSLKNYLNAIKNLLFSNDVNYSLSSLVDLYGTFLRKDINVNDINSYLRQVELVNEEDNLIKGQHYDASPLRKLPSLINELFIFNDSRVFDVLKGIIVYYYLCYIKPFDYFNEECALLSLKLIIGSNDYKNITFLLNLENDFLDFNDDNLKKEHLKSELSLDLTYFINYVLDKLLFSIDNLEIDTSDNLSVSLIAKEYNTQARENVISSQTVLSNINFEKKVSLPTLPVGLDEKDKNIIVDSLLEMYPSLKKMQAIFYASHCTIGKYYSIAQYKKETNVAYETARTSMDNLESLGFYKKEKIKNKFVYTPVVREENKND